MAAISLRRKCVVFIGMLGAGLAAAVPLGSGRAEGDASEALRTEAAQYAQYIVQFATCVEAQYVRPVPRVEVLEAALTGLFEAARQPVPPALRQDLTRMNAGELIHFVARLREGLGAVDALRQERSLTASMAAAARVLDPYCGLSGPQEFGRPAAGVNPPDLDPNGEHYWEFGLGLELVDHPVRRDLRAMELDGNLPANLVPSVSRLATKPLGPLRVKAVTAGSPAQRAGIRPDDLIVRRVNGQPCEELSAETFTRLFNPSSEPERLGRRGRSILSPPRSLGLSIRRSGRESELAASLMPTYYRPESVFGTSRRSDGTWSFLLDGPDRIGYVRVAGIRSKTANEAGAAFSELQSQNVRGVVLDLRWCPGGLLDEGVGIASCLLPGSMPIARVSHPRKPEAQRDETRNTHQGRVILGDVPLLVLVNGETSGGGELIAGAIQDHNRGTIAGERSVGKASVQQSLDPNPTRIGFKITTGTFLRPSGKSLQRFPDSKPTDDWGIRPDAGFDLPLSPELGRQLKGWYHLQTLRPPDSRDALVLDDPDADPQLRAAVELLRGLIKR